MFNIGGGELIVILVIALIVLGPEKLPDAVRRAGRIYGELRRMSSGFQAELRDAIDAGTFGQAAPRQDMTLAQLADEYLERDVAVRHAATRMAYVYSLHVTLGLRVAPHCGHRLYFELPP